MSTIVDAAYVKTCGRPIGRVDDSKLQAYITEAEMLHVKPVLGDALYLAILNDLGKPDGERDAKYTLLLDGGTYTSYLKEPDGELKMFSGLKLAIGYFVSAQNVMSGDFESTRFGTMLKQDDYSNHLSSKERSDYYNNLQEVANAYLQECVEYCLAVSLIKRKGQPKVSVGGCTIKRVGR